MLDRFSNTANVCGIQTWKKILYHSKVFNAFVPKEYVPDVKFLSSHTLIDYTYKLGLRSLQYRRLETGLIMYFKIIYKLINLPFEDFFSFIVSPCDTRSHKFCVKVLLPRSEFQKSFFSRRTISVWNKLPADLVCSPTLQIFRAKLRTLDLHNFAELLF